MLSPFCHFKKVFLISIHLISILNAMEETAAPGMPLLNPVTLISKDNARVSIDRSIIMAPFKNGRPLSSVLERTFSCGMQESATQESRIEIETGETLTAFVQHLNHLRNLKIQGTDFDNHEVYAQTIDRLSLPLADEAPAATCELLKISDMYDIDIIKQAYLKALANKTHARDNLRFIAQSEAYKTLLQLSPEKTRYLTLSDEHIDQTTITFPAEEDYHPKVIAPNGKFFATVSKIREPDHNPLDKINIYSINHYIPEAPLASLIHPAPAPMMNHYDCITFSQSLYLAAISEINRAHIWKIKYKAINATNASAISAPSPEIHIEDVCTIQPNNEDEEISYLTFSKNETKLAIAYYRGLRPFYPYIDILNLNESNGQFERTLGFSVGSRPVRSMQFSPDETKLIITHDSDEQAIHVVQLKPQSWWQKLCYSCETQDLKGHRIFNIKQAVFSPDEKTIASVDAESMHTWNFNEISQQYDAGQIFIYNHDDNNHGNYESIAFSPDSFFLAVATLRSSVLLWGKNATTNMYHPLRNIQNQRGLTFEPKIQYSPDGSELMLRSSDALKKYIQKYKESTATPLQAILYSSIQASYSNILDLREDTPENLFLREIAESFTDPHAKDYIQNHVIMPETAQAGQRRPADDDNELSPPLQSARIE